LRNNLESVGLLLLRLEIRWLLEPIASRIDNGDNGERDLSMRQSSAASAAIVGASNSKEVIVSNVL